MTDILNYLAVCRNAGFEQYWQIPLMVSYMVLMMGLCAGLLLNRDPDYRFFAPWVIVTALGIAVFGPLKAVHDAAVADQVVSGQSLAATLKTLDPQEAEAVRLKLADYLARADYPLTQSDLHFFLEQMAQHDQARRQAQALAPGN